MFDSRTDRPVINGTHRAGHALRSYREHGKGDFVQYGTPRQRLMVLPKAERDAIAEGLADYEAQVRDELSSMDVSECIDAMGDALFYRDLMDGLLYDTDPGVLADRMAAAAGL